MKKKYSIQGGGYKLSLIANCISLALFIIIGVWKFDSIKRRFSNIFIKQQTSEKVLKSFNNDYFDLFLNEEHIVNPESECVEFLFLGNSLTYTGVPEEEADKTKRGLTSTKIENDYVHRLISMYAKKYDVNVKFSCVNIADFERGFLEKEFTKDSLKNIQVKNPDIVIFQIGENVSLDELKNNEGLFFERYCGLINCFKDSQKVVCIPFWPIKEKINVITDVAFETNSRICDLSHLGSGIDEENFASSYKYYKQPGVGSHPGDVGMERIAKNLLCVLDD